MKNFLMISFLIPFLIFTSFFCKAQEVWAPKGAIWYYDYFNIGAVGYVRVEYIGDKMVAGIQTKVLQKIWIGMTQSDGFEIDTLGNEYIYVSNDTVFNYRYEQFYVLYDFSSVAGSQWIVGGNPAFPNCGTTGEIAVDSTGVVTVNSLSLKYLYVKPLSFKWALRGRIVERVGPIDSYMFPEPMCVADLFEGGPLRCYYDSTFGWYSTGLTKNCSDIVGLENILASANKLLVYPNPARNKLTLHFNALAKTQKPTTLYFYDFTGRMVMKKNISGNERELTIDVHDLSAGVYVVSVEGEKFSEKAKVVIE